MSKQKLFWISKRSVYGRGVLRYGDEVGSKIPEDMIPHFKSTGEIGSIEMASSDNVEVQGAYDALKIESDALKEKLLEYEVVSESVIEALQADSLKKDVKQKLVSDLEALK